ncbi:MAG: Ig-like domain-containing protein [Candidatus Marinimicrobia bacterium]|nr:Ig-like domain-containing protein [Candidatus Neomarinimicrobiota bacterium]
MPGSISKLISGIIFFAIAPGCETNIYEGDIFEGDDVWYDGQFRGEITGTVKQSDSGAWVIVSQVEPVDSAAIDPANGSFGIYGLRIGNYDLRIRAENYRTYVHKNVMVQGGGIAYMGEIDLSTVPDLVTEHYPRDMDEIVYSSRWQRINISILFTREMDRESVEAAFSTDPPTEGVFFWGLYTQAPSPRYYIEALSGAFDAGATITTFSKITSLTYQMAQKDSYSDTTYHVTLSTEAMDTAGVHLRFPLEYSFSTVQSAVSYAGIQTSPFHGDVDVSPMTNTILVTFPRRMDPATTEQAVNIKPAQEFFFLWPEKNVLKIYAGAPLMADTSYEITITRTAEDLDGMPLGDDFTFSFSTAPVSVTSTSPYNSEVYVSPGAEITMWFNTFMVKSTVVSAFAISPVVSGSIRWGTAYSPDVKNALTFWPLSNLQINTKYTVTIDTQASDLHGTGLTEPYSFTFITRPEQ